MRIPTIRGLIDRRVLVNFRVDPYVLATILPLPSRRSFRCDNWIDRRIRRLPAAIAVSGGTGGVAALNHRLIAKPPTGVNCH